MKRRQSDTFGPVLREKQIRHFSAKRRKRRERTQETRDEKHAP